MRSRVPIDLLHPGPLGIAVAALLGAVIGSFLNVCILRWGAEPKESIVSPPSHCPRCGRGLAWYENIPVVSWLLLRARCRGCGEPISMHVPADRARHRRHLGLHGVAPRAHLEALRGAVFGTILLGIAMTDARQYIIPDEFTWGGLVIGLLFSLAGGLAGSRARRCSAPPSASACSGWWVRWEPGCSRRTRWEAGTSR